MCWKDKVRKEGMSMWLHRQEMLDVNERDHAQIGKQYCLREASVTTHTVSHSVQWTRRHRKR
jgi:hypothetical protein